MVVAAVGWGTGGIATRAAFDQGADPWLLVTMRVIIAALLVMGLLLIQRSGIPDRHSLRIGLVMAVTNLVLPYVLFTFAYAEASAGFVGLFALWRRSCPTDETLYWSSALIVVLLCGPVSWAMGVVWLLVLVPVVLRELPRSSGIVHRVFLAAAVLGLLIVGAPDPHTFTTLSPAVSQILNQKYVVGQLFCLAGLMGLRCRGSV